MSLTVGLSECIFVSHSAKVWHWHTLWSDWWTKSDGVDMHAGLVKVVFATGTLAAGINMPARSTVINAVSRRIPGGHVSLTHNELLQMAGRAGRRGFDVEGDAPGSPSLRKHFNCDASYDGWTDLISDISSRRDSGRIRVSGHSCW